MTFVPPDIVSQLEAIAPALHRERDEPRLYVLTFTAPWRRWLPIRVRATWEKVCTWDEALAMQARIRAEGATDCEVRRGEATSQSRSDS